MENLLDKLDVEKYIGEVVLTDGTKLKVPKITMLKIVKIVKFIGLDAMKLYNEMKEVINDEFLDEITKVAVIFEKLKEEQLIRLFSILLDTEDEFTLWLDHNEMLDVILVYVEKTNITKTFSQVRQIYKKMFNRDLPDLTAWMNTKIQAANQLQAQRQEVLKAIEEAEQAGKL